MEKLFIHKSILGVGMPCIPIQIQILIVTFSKVSKISSKISYFYWDLPDINARLDSLQQQIDQYQSFPGRKNEYPDIYDVDLDGQFGEVAHADLPFECMEKFPSKAPGAALIYQPYPTSEYGISPRDAVFLMFERKITQVLFVG